MFKKFYKKIRLLRIPPEVQAAIDAEYNALYEEKRENLNKLFGDEFSGMYFRWFDEEMWHQYCYIKDKHMAEYLAKKCQKPKEKEML